MLVNARPVFVIQDRSTGLFVHNDLMWVKSLRLAGRADSYENALSTAECNGYCNVEIHQFFEVRE